MPWSFRSEPDTLGSIGEVLEGDGFDLSCQGLTISFGFTHHLIIIVDERVVIQHIRYRVLPFGCRKIYTELCNQKGNPNIVTFKEQLNLISRILVWDDQNNRDLFEYSNL
jgi:hypothetical protein